MENIEDLVCDSYDFLLSWENIKADGIVPQSRHAHSTCIIGNYIYLFGGYSLSNRRGIHLDDFFKFHIPTQHWDRLPLSKHYKVPPRHSHTMVAYNESFWIFGGIGHEHNSNTPVIYNDIIEYNTRTCEFILHNNQSDSNGYIPSPRWGHSAVVYKDQMLVFGGMNEFTFFSSVISFNFITKQWSQLEVFESGINPAPHGRQYHTSAVVDDKLYVLAGYDGVLCLNDMFELDLKTLIWRGISGNPPHPSRRGAATQVYNKCIYIFGGRHKKIHDSLFEFNTQTLKWREISAGNRPSKRQSSTSILYNDYMYIFGGQSDQNENDIYRINLNNNNNNNNNSNCNNNSGFYYSMLNNELFSDVKFKIDEKIIYAHKCILVSRNEKFKAMITSNMAESRQDIIEINHVSYSVFMTILYWIYTGEIHFKNVNILQLISIADQYLMLEIKSLCSKGLIKYVTKKNYEHIQVLAESYELKELLQYINNLKKEIELQQQQLQS